MSKKQKLKSLRKEIRSRWYSQEREAVAREVQIAMAQGEKKTKKLYLSALDPILYDEANKHE